MKDVNITIGRFQPFTKGHLSCIESVYNELGLPTVICMIDVKDEKVDEKHPFPSSMLLPMYQDVFAKNKMIADIVLIKSANIVEIGEMLYKMGYQIKSWSCGTDRLAPYEKMASKYAGQAHLSPDFKMFEIKRTDADISATKVRNAILKDDYKTFAAMTPLATLKSKLTGKNYYNELKDQINKVVK